MEKPYPVQYSVDYPDRPLNRLTTALRLLWVIPIGIVLVFLGSSGARSGSSVTIPAGGAGVLFVPVLLMLVFRRKYPRWWFDWNLQVARFANRVAAYLFLMDDRYPATDADQSVHLEYVYPDAKTQLNRWMPLIKWFLAIPHYVVLVILFSGVIFAVMASWLVILFTGRYPVVLFNYVQGVLRWENRVAAYALALVTDEYPPFRLEP